jgi:cell division protease FtsH
MAGGGVFGGTVNGFARYNARRAPLLFSLAIAGVLAFFLNPTGLAQPPEALEVSVSRIADEVSAGRVQTITVRGDRLEATLHDGRHFRSWKESGVSILTTFRELGVEQRAIDAIDVVVEPESGGGWLTVLIWLLPFLFIIGFLFMLRRGGAVPGQEPGGAIDAFTRSKARRITADRPVIRFDDVAGVEEAKEELREIVEFLKHPAKFIALGAHIPRGVLLIGPPGTGKTLFARAVAGEAGVPFFSQSGSEFVEMFVGVGASRARDLFRQARENAPSIVFIDEIDAIGRRRGAGVGHSNEEREQTLNQILAELDGFDPRSNVVIMAATNRPDVLDPALLRPGRFDRRVTLENPDLEGRLAILGIHARGKPLAPEVDLRQLARLTPGFSGADLENLLNEAALLTGRRDKSLIGMPELEEAIDRVMVGPQRRGHRLSPWEQKVTAYHEAGHALVAHLLPHAPSVHKVSIVARGAVGGHTQVLPDEERHLWTRSQLQDTLAYSLGGLAAERVVFDEASTGASNDLEQATRLALKMVVEFGMSETIGPVSFGHYEESYLLPESRRAFSEQTAVLVDDEVHQLVCAARDRALQSIAEHREQLETLTALLLERETLQGAELQRALGPTQKASLAA